MMLALVRHGVSESNAANEHQDAQAKLTDLGRQQAEIVRTRLQRLAFTRFLSSPLPRAMETASIIGGGHTIITDDRLVEIRKPQALSGLQYQHPQYREIRTQLTTNGHTPGWRHSDEEDLYTFHDRVASFLFSLDEADTLVVTHSGVIRMTLALILHPNTKAEDVVKAYIQSRTELNPDIQNGSITFLQKTPPNSQFTVRTAQFEP